MDVQLILVPYDSAHRGRRLGAGPERLIESGLLDAIELRGHVVRTIVIEAPDDRWRAEIGTAFQLANGIAEQVRGARRVGALPVVLAGNCMATLGVVAGLGPGTTVLWFDAHADFNTPETTVGGFLDGMSLATVTGRCWTAMTQQLAGFEAVGDAQVWLTGARDLDPLEAEALTRTAVNRIGAGDVGASLPDLVRRDGDEPGPLHVHLDLDVLDPRDGRANEYAAPHGVRADNLIAACHALGERAAPSALTVSAYDPRFDADGRVARTAIDAVGAMLDGLTAFG